MKQVTVLAAILMTLLLAACGDTIHNHYNPNEAGVPVADAGTTPDTTSADSNADAAAPDAYRFNWPDKGIKPDSTVAQDSTPTVDSAPKKDAFVFPDSKPKVDSAPPPPPLKETIVDKSDFSMKAGTKVDMEGKLYYMDVVGKVWPIPGNQLTLAVSAGSTVTVVNNTSGRKLLLEAKNLDGITEFIWCWTKGTTTNTDDLCEPFKVIVFGSQLPPDAGLPDSSPPDAGMPDASPPDTGLPDTGTPDSQLPDTGSSDSVQADAGAGDSTAADSSTSDAGVGDSLVADSGSSDAVAPTPGTLTVTVVADGLKTGGATVKATSTSPGGLSVTKTSVAGVDTVFTLTPDGYKVEASKTGYDAKSAGTFVTPAGKVKISLALTKAGGGGANSLVLKKDFVLPGNGSIDMCGKLYYLNASLVETAVPCAEMKLAVTFGTTVTVANNPASQPLLLLASATDTGYSDVEWTWDRGTPATTDDLKSTFKVYVYTPPSP